MRAAALLLLAACSTAAEPNQFSFLQYAQLARALECTQGLGLSRCVRAFGVWSAKHSLNSDLMYDLERFPWKSYRNVSEDVLDSGLFEGTMELLKYKPLTMYLPGYRAKLNSKVNGTLSLDVYEDNEVGTARGNTKKMQQQFYRIVPYLMLPGLLMSAVLPFILPALKMMTVGVGILNQMALSGAIFTLLRNNAFSDKYQHKVVYANVGYKNEHKNANKWQEVEHTHHTHEHFNNEHDLTEHNAEFGGHFDINDFGEATPEWVNPYYGQDANVQKTDRIVYKPKEHNYYANTKSSHKQE